MLILASNSPRRKQLLSLGGWDFQVIPAEIDETPLPGENPREYVLRLAREKARQVALRIAESDSLVSLDDTTSLVIAADTTVALEGNILGKPADAGEAAAMLWQLRGRTHQVYTALAILRLRDSALLSQVCTTDVPMRPYNQEEMLAYIATGDPFDKAGAYAIQHADFHPVEELQGCYTNVMGLPMCLLARQLRDFGLDAKNDIPRAMEQELGYTCPIFTRVLEGAPCGDYSILSQR